jgi:hypothetical protein
MAEPILKARKSEIIKRIHTLEWDKSKNQINFAHEKLLKDLKEELKTIEEQLNGA